MKGQITDIGCGLGPLCYMLSMISKERQILGIDYDEDKIAIAQHGCFVAKTFVLNMLTHRFMSSRKVMSSS